MVAQVAAMGQPIDIERYAVRIGRWHESIIYPAQIGQVGILTFDITERKAAEKALETAHRRTADILESIQDYFYSIDREGRIIYVNQAAADLWGKSRKDLVGQIIWDVFPETVGSHAYQQIQEAMQAQRAVHFETVSPLSGVWMSVHVYPTLEGGLSLIFRDISQQKKAEAALKQYTTDLERSNRDLQNFTVVTSHDLQEPLRIIEAFGDALLEYDLKMDQRQSDLIRRMRKSAHEMRQMLAGLLQFSQITTEAQSFQPVDLHTLVQEILKDFDEQIRQAGGVVEVGELPVIEADRLQMRKLLQHLIENALKFQPPGGKPQVKISSYQSTPDVVQIKIEDNGIGFDPEYVEHLYEPFERLVGKNQPEYDGVGMGLAICRWIVERHGGEITTSSRSGKGTKFTILLPTDQQIDRKHGIREGANNGKQTRIAHRGR